MKFRVNRQVHDLDVEAEMPLLWLLRDVLGLTGTKYGCGIAACGACTVWIDGAPARSCSVAAEAAAGREVLTIEGLGAERLHAVQQAWIETEVPQCGYCQPGMIMAAAALLKATPQPNDADIDRAMTNLCRCGTYVRVRQAIHAAAKKIAG